MRIGIDTRVLETGHRFRGIGSYAQNLIKRISRIDLDHHYIFFCQKLPSAASTLIKKNDFFFEDYLVRKTQDPTRYHWFLDQVYFPLAIKKSGIKIVHILDQLSCPIIKSTKTIITVHDLIQISKLSPSSFKNKIKLLPIKYADRIIAISKAVRNDLIRILKIPQEKIEVIYNGYDREIFKPKFNQIRIENFRKKLLNRKADKYLLYIGSFGEYEPRKNLDFLIEVFSEFVLVNRQEKIALVMIGKLGLESERIKNLLNQKGLLDKVIFTDHVQHKDLASYFQAAELFLFPSLVEGFGLPPLEAMASGCPVISSNTTSLPEVVGDGGVLLEPTDISAWVVVIKKLSFDEDYKKELIKRGLEQAKKFSWEKSAQETFKLYEEVYRGEN